MAFNTVEEIKKNQGIFDEIMQGDYSNHEKLTYITPKVARELIKYKKGLDLSGLTSISVEIARELAKHEIWIALSGLASITVEVARELAKHKGEIYAKPHIEKEIEKYK